MKKIEYVSDIHERLKQLVLERLPWLILGLGIGFLTSLYISRYEEILARNISLAFFIPIIVYMSDAVGTQTETIFVRDLSQHRSNFLKYLKKEFSLGLVMGAILGLLIAVGAYLWLKNLNVAATVGLAMFLNVMIAPVTATIIPELLFKERQDPALGAGPFTTVLQDLISLMIYFLVASIILL